MLQADIRHMCYAQVCPVKSRIGIVDVIRYMHLKCRKYFTTAKADRPIRKSEITELLCFVPIILHCSLSRTITALSRFQTEIFLLNSGFCPFSLSRLLKWFVLGCKINACRKQKMDEICGQGKCDLTWFRSASNWPEHHPI